MTNETNLLEQLEQNKKWPLRYMFKFIAPNNDEIVAQIKKELPKSEKIMAKLSKNGKYIAITSIAMMNSAKEIVAITDKINAIKGVLAL